MNVLKPLALIGLLLFAAACASPNSPGQSSAAAKTSPTQPSAASQATLAPVMARPTAPVAAMIQPNQVSINTYGLPYPWQANLVPATPYTTSQPPGPMGLPEHIEINFGTLDPKNRQFNDPIMYIIPVDAYRQMWDNAGNPSVSATIDKIFNLTVALPVPPPAAGMPALPPEAIQGVNDLAAALHRVKYEADSASKSGYRFVGRWAQDANPVSNQGLRYVYQGFTNDGRYLVSFIYPVTTTALPAPGAIPADDMLAFQTNVQTYLQSQAQKLTALPSSAWQPDLNTLDQVVASLRIQGMPTTGLHNTLWQWVDSSYRGKDTPVTDPTQYELVYRPDGTLSIKADCNTASAKYTHDGGMVGVVRVEPGPMTLAACPAGSRSEELIKAVTAAQDYRVQPGGGLLKLNLPADGPVLTFRNAGPAPKP